MLDRPIEAIMTPELKAAMASGSVVVEYSDQSTVDAADVSLTVRPAPLAPPPKDPPPPPVVDVELALATERLKVAQERLADLEGRFETLEKDYDDLAGNDDADDVQQAAPTVEKHHYVHKRCWGSWILAVLVACELYTQHHEMVEGWLRSLGFVRA